LRSDTGRGRGNASRTCPAMRVTSLGLVICLEMNEISWILCTHARVLPSSSQKSVTTATRPRRDSSRMQIYCFHVSSQTTQSSSSSSNGAGSLFPNSASYQSSKMRPLTQMEQHTTSSSNPRLSQLYKPLSRMYVSFPLSTLHDPS
jgi:hypothetical protein